LNPELDLTPAHRRKALAGRVLELSGAAKLGKGEKSVRDKERNKASKRVREGIIEKQKERDKQDLEEVSLNRLSATNSQPNSHCFRQKIWATITPR
jgi:hypothetical protein